MADSSSPYSHPWPFLVTYPRPRSDASVVPVAFLQQYNSSSPRVFPAMSSDTAAVGNGSGVSVQSCLVVLEDSAQTPVVVLVIVCVNPHEEGRRAYLGQLGSLVVIVIV